MADRLHLLFAGAIVLLVALGAWWTVFLSRSVELERQAHLAELRHAAESTAILLGHEPSGPVLPAQGAVPLELVDQADCDPTALCAPMRPLHGDQAVRPSPAAIQAVEDKLTRRRVMVLGEGGLLFLLIGVVVLMLARLLHQEARHLSQMEEFVSAITHEMKTPLAGIKSLLQTMEAGQLPPDRQGPLLALGLQEAERLEHTIENVLLSGAIRTDRLHVHPEDLPLRAQLEDFVEHRARTLPDRPGALRLEWGLAEDDAVVHADAHALRVVLENLVDNGLKYGGESPVVRLAVRPAHEGVLIEVCDEGVGFDPRRAEQLFTPFRREPGFHGHHGHGRRRSEERAGVQHGTGLGLSIARTLMRRMGGELTAHSAGPGQGACFEVSLRSGEAP